MARVLGEAQREGLLRLHGLALADTRCAPDCPVSVRAAGGSKVRFALTSLAGGFGCTHFLYDAASVAQLHQFPGRGRKPAMMYIHGIEVWEQAPARYIEAARRMTILVANSQYTREKAERLHGGFARARVCWLATESDTPAPAGVPLEERAPNVLIVGRLVGDRPKGHRELIACWPEVMAAVPGATLHIVGDGPGAAQLQALAANSPAAPNIVFHGFVPEEALDSHYAQARVFAMPSRGEGFGLVYIEAMRHGLPVVASVHDAAPEVVVEGQTGYVVDQDRPGELADRLVRLLQKPEHAAQLGEAGRRRWAEHFCYSAFRQRFRPLLHEFLQL
jgi:phosphatidylinositol alpha-1,6-mannosyltransferase